MYVARSRGALLTRRVGKGSGHSANASAAATAPLQQGDVRLREDQEPQRYRVGPGMYPSIGTSSLTTLIRLASGTFIVGYGASFPPDDASSYSPFRAGGRRLDEYTSLQPYLKRPTSSLPTLYLYNGCPFCMLVLEAVSSLDVDVLIKPTPRGSPSFRNEAENLGGKQQFPLLHDESTNKVMYESSDIIRYLAKTYAGGHIPWQLRIPGGSSPLAAAPGVLLRGGRGRQYQQARSPEQPLRLWGYTGSPFVRTVLERLCELELPYVYITTARGSPKRQSFFNALNHFQVPYLEDPNEGLAMYESSDILSFLDSTYRSA